ncbi:general transcription factor IIE subunit 2-like [Chenopodium quinoa]|uniref:general transcription factor IIE subunit 2-like n=1 Tax=Chenopodium quinoa TaxID=63459 RepID=UPI000B77AFB1|nr:general transcription factor IIE subunit 2-like [Chenopodium quinoa]
MSLQENLARFRKQQEKCQSTLSSIASEKQASTKSSNPPKHNSNVQKSTLPTASPSINARPPVKFSNDTERLQIINSIRKAPAGAQIKRVIDLLLERREALTPEQINQVCHVDVYANKTVFESLKNNPKVSYDGQCFSYKSKHEVKNKDQLLVLIRRYPEGMPIIDLKDSYINVMEDLQALKADRKVWLLSNFDSQEDIVYPDDPRVSFKVDDDLKQFFRSIELPRDFLDVEKELQKTGIKPLTNTAQRRAAAQIQGVSSKNKPKKKKHEISKRTKLTNAHLPELFQNLDKVANCLADIAAYLLFFLCLDTPSSFLWKTCIYIGCFTFVDKM